MVFLVAELRSSWDIVTLYSVLISLSLPLQLRSSWHIVFLQCRRGCGPWLALYWSTLWENSNAPSQLVTLYVLVPMVTGGDCWAVIREGKNNGEEDGDVSDDHLQLSLTVLLLMMMRVYCSLFCEIYVIKRTLVIRSTYMSLLPVSSSALALVSSMS